MSSRRALPLENRSRWLLLLALVATGVGVCSLLGTRDAQEALESGEVEAPDPSPSTAPIEIQGEGTARAALQEVAARESEVAPRPTASQQLRIVVLKGEERATAAPMSGVRVRIARHDGARPAGREVMKRTDPEGVASWDGVSDGRL